MTEYISSLVEHIDIFALSTLEVESSPHSFTSSRDSYASCVSWGDAVPSEARNFGRLHAGGHGCGPGRGTKATAGGVAFAVNVVLAPCWRG